MLRVGQRQWWDREPPFGTEAQHFTAGHEHLQSGTGLTTVPHNGIKPRTGTKSRTEARLARCASRCPLYTSVDSDWPPSSRAQSARAVHARTSRCGRPTACLLRLSDDQSQGVLFAASVAARGETVVRSRAKLRAGSPSNGMGAGSKSGTKGA